MDVQEADRATRPAWRWALKRIGGQIWAGVRLTALASWRGLAGFYNSDDLTHAAAIAYYALLSLFPFLLVVLAVLGAATASEERRTMALQFVLRYFPAQFEFLTRQLDAFRQTRLPLGLAGAAALIWAALGVFGAVTSAVNHAWGVDRQPSFLKHKLVSFVMLLAASGVLLVALLLVSAIEIAGSPWFAGIVGRFPGLLFLTSITIKSAAMLLLILVVGLIYYFVPNAKVRFVDVWVGAVVTGLLLRGLTAGFSWYLRDMSRLNLIHGSIATVVAFLLWVYLSAVVLLYGVEFTAAYGRLRRRRPEEIPAAPSPRT